MSESGIINIQKYDYGMSYNAMPTLFNTPVAMSPADLKASQVDVAILGAVTDMGTGVRGAAHGPNAVRNSQVYGSYGARQPHMHTMVDPLQDLVVADFGNAPIDIMSTERSVHAIRSFVRSAAEVEERGFPAVMEDVIREAPEGPEYLFVSFDIDTLDPSYVPGTGTPEPGGLTPREAFPILRRLCAESNVVGFELVELAPMLDPTYVSALNANRLIKECMTGIAMRKKGLTKPHYLSPLTRSHGKK